MYVHLSWGEGGTAKDAEHGDGFKVYHKRPSDSGYTLLATITSISTTTYDDTDLPESGTYYYQVYEYKDATMDEAASVNVVVTLNSAPTAPTDLLCESSTNPQVVTSLTPIFSAIYNDPDSGDTSTQAYVEVNVASDFSGTVMWDSGWLTISSVTEGNKCANITYAGTALSKDGSTYYWRIKFKDAGGLEGAVSATANFRMQNAASVSLTEDMGLAASMSKEIGANLLESLSVSAAISGMDIATMKAEVLALADNATFQKAFVRNFVESLALSETNFIAGNLKHIAMTLKEGLALSDSLEKSLAIQRALEEVLAMDADESADIGKNLTEPLAFAAALKRTFGRTFTEDLVLTDSMKTDLVVSYLLTETLGLKDRLGIGDVWANPTSALWTEIVKSIIETQVM